MFKINDCFSSSGVFNETLVKRFEENWDPKIGSRLWMIPGHVIYTTTAQKIRTCDARPLDLLSPSELNSGGELTVTPAPILNISFDTDCISPRMYIPLSNGDVQIFEYRALLYEWARVGYFNVNIVSPNSINNHHFVVHQVFISSYQNTVYWSEKTDSSEMCYNLQRRSLPPHSVREITQSALGIPQTLLRNCPDFKLLDVLDNVCIIPHLPNSINIYLILSARSHLWLFDISGKCLWRGIITDYPIDFMSLCVKTVGLWSQHGTVKVCKLLDSTKHMAYLLHDQTLLSITANGEISKKTQFDLVLDKSYEYYILQNILCVLAKHSLSIHSLENGKILQILDLKEYMPIRGTWFHRSRLPSIGFYCDSGILQLQYQSLISIFNSNIPCFSQALSLLTQGNFHLFGVLKDLVHHNFTVSEMQPLENIPVAFQSKALLIALIQSCREKGLSVDKFPFGMRELQNVLSSEEASGHTETKLKKLLEPLVDCYCKIENAKNLKL